MRELDLKIKILDALPPLEDDVSFKVQESAPDIFIIALGKPSLPWKERFCQITIGTWGLADKEVEELIDVAVKDLIAQAGSRGFFVTSVGGSDRSPNPFWKHPAEDVTAPTPRPLGEYVVELEGKVLDLEQQLARSDRVVNAIQEALDL